MLVLETSLGLVADGLRVPPALALDGWTSSRERAQDFASET